VIARWGPLHDSPRHVQRRIPPPAVSRGWTKLIPVDLYNSRAVPPRGRKRFLMPSSSCARRWANEALSRAGQPCPGPAPFTLTLEHQPQAGCTDRDRGPISKAETQKAAPAAADGLPDGSKRDSVPSSSLFPASKRLQRCLSLPTTLQPRHPRNPRRAPKLAIPACRPRSSQWLNSQALKHRSLGPDHIGVELDRIEPVFLPMVAAAAQGPLRL